MTYRLRIVEGAGSSRCAPLDERAVLLVGRGDACGVRLNDPSASRVHCRLTVAGGKVFIEDAGSRWGTTVNGHPIESRELILGDIVIIGETELRLEIDAAQAVTIAPTRRPARIGPVQISPDDLVGKRFHQFQVDSIVARTRSGTVFRAVDSEFERSVALKVFRPDCFADETARQRFRRAVDATLPLRHKHLVTLHDAGEWEGLCFTASEFIEGESAAQVIQRIGVAGMLDWRTTHKIAVDLGAALAFIESQGVIHRNITPQHILISSADGAARLNDLSLAKALDDSRPQLTTAGDIVGDLPYLSPEQVGSGQPIDHRSDIHQLGATLYALLTGRPPFEGGTAAEVIQRIVSAQPVPPTKYHLSVPALLEGVVLSMLAKRPADRISSACQLLRQLEQIRAYLT